MSNAVTESYREVSPAEAYAARGTARLIDVREAHEFAGGHVPGAELVPLGTLPQHLVRWDQTVEIIVVCRSGGRSACAAETLVRAGFRRVLNLSGGMQAYVAAQLPVART